MVSEPCGKSLNPVEEVFCKASSNIKTTFKLEIIVELSRHIDLINIIINLEKQFHYFFDHLFLQILFTLKRLDLKSEYH